VGLGAEDRLRYRPPGYILGVGDDELDAAEFERLVSLAREEAGSGDHAQALDLVETPWAYGAVRRSPSLPTSTSRVWRRTGCASCGSLPQRTGSTA
jgi:hypothetical protein